MIDLETPVLNDLGVTLHNRYLRIGGALVIADLHLGKTMHFRKAGLPVPPPAREADQLNLLHLLQNEQPNELIVLGDLFHSSSNSEIDELRMITTQFPEIHFELVLGNHDILERAVYHSLDFEVCDQKQIGKFLMTHEPLDEVPAWLINMHGHIHPGIKLQGRGKQSVMLPCFHLSKTHFCLPAFGALTGLAKRNPRKSDRIFAIANNNIFEWEV
ncbi:MAG: ligase-associated DNA damage response endonuclease PdeM [Flavobacteriales bacterium]|nr:ligase-associated DNA damage response endonuclease PdeM [Flavobacteriales bacterium]MBT6979442.1 ligase-associated DNA damage response endonuclease PdeM [Flavobacteriales bacterium]